MARIQLDNISHSYDQQRGEATEFAVKGVDHVWEQGGAYALLGPSGCGKSTMLNIISGLITPTHGRVLFDDRDVTALTPAQRNIAQVFQFPVIYDSQSVYWNLAFPLRNRGIAAHDVDRRVRKIASVLDLTDSLDQRAQRLTSDAKQKISLGRALVREDVGAILFDEPLTTIDPHLKWQLRSTLRQLHREFDFTMVYVTHDQTEALTFADTVVVMHDGEMVQVGTPEELFERPEHVFVGYFIGSPGMNLLPAEVSGNQAQIAGHAIALSRSYPAMKKGGRVEIGVRPEFVALSRGGDGVPVRIERVDDLGRIKIVRTELGGQPFNVVIDGDKEVPADDARIGLDMQRVHVYADGRIVEGEVV